MNEKFVELYNYLSSNNLTDLSQDDFYSKYSDPSKASEIYKYLSSKNMTDLDEQSFYSSYFGSSKKKEPTVSDGEQRKPITTLATAKQKKVTLPSGISGSARLAEKASFGAAKGVQVSQEEKEALEKEKRIEAEYEKPMEVPEMVILPQIDKGVQTVFKDGEYFQRVLLQKQEEYPFSIGFDPLSQTLKSEYTPWRKVDNESEISRLDENYFGGLPNKRILDQRKYISQVEAVPFSMLMNSSQGDVVDYLNNYWSDKGITAYESGSKIEVVDFNGRTKIIDRTVDGMRELKEFMKSISQEEKVATERMTLTEYRNYQVEKYIEDPGSIGKDILEAEELVMSTIKSNIEDIKARKNQIFKDLDEIKKAIAANGGKKNSDINKRIAELQLEKETLYKDVKALTEKEKLINLATGIALEKKRKSEEKIGTFSGAFYNKLLEGITNTSEAAASLAIDIMPTILDFAGIESMPEIQYEKYKSEGKTDAEIIDIAKKELKKDIIPELDKGLVELIGSETTDAYINSEDRNMFEKALVGLAESIPSMATGIGGKGMALFSMAAMSYAHIDSEMRDDPDFENVSENEKKLIAIPYAIGMGYLERLGFTEMLSKNPAAKSMLNKVVFNAIKKTKGGENIAAAVKNGIDNELASGIFRIAGGAIIEAETGAAQEVLNLAVKDVYSLAKGERMFDDPQLFSSGGAAQIGESALLEGIGGMFMKGALETPVMISRGIKSSKVNKELAAIMQDFSSDADMKSLVSTKLKTQIMAGEITTDEAKNIMTSYDEVMGIMNKIPQGLKPNIDKAFDLLLEKQKIEKQIDGKDKALVKDDIDRISQINAELETLSKEQIDAIQEQTAGEVPVQPETEVGGKMEEGTPESKPKVVTEKSNQEKIDELEGIIASDNQSMQENGYGNLAPEAREEVLSELDKLKTQKTANELIVSSHEKDGGSSISQSGENLMGKPGYSVSIHTDRTQIVDGQNVTEQQLEEFKRKNADLLDDTNNFVGTWFDKKSGKTYIDISTYEGNIDKARKMGADANQKAIFDLQNGVEIDTGGTGTVTTQNYQTVESAIEGKERNENDDRKSDVYEAVRTSLKASPDTKIVVHETRDEYLDAIANKTGMTRTQIEAEEAEGATFGSYLTEDGEVHIDLTGADKQTVFHEVFHDIVKQLGIESKAMIDMVKDLKAVVTDKALLAKIDKFTEAYERGERDEEFLAEIVSDLAANAGKLDTTRLQKLITIINKIASKLGLTQVLSNRASRSEVVDFVNRMAKSLREGRGINISEMKAETKEEIKKRLKRIDVDKVRSKDRPGKRISKGLSVKGSGDNKIATETDGLSIEYVKKNAPKVFISNANILASYHLVNGVKKFGKVTTLDQAQDVYNIFTREVADNLKYLMSEFNQELRDVSTLWYDGANLIANNLAEKYGTTPEQVAGIIASLSPQKDWYMNVRLAELVLDAYAKNPIVTKEMVDYQMSVANIGLYENNTSPGKKLKKAENKYKKSKTKANKEALDIARDKMIKAEYAVSKVMAMLESHIGENLKSIPEHVQPYVVRTYHEVNTTKDYNKLTPDGNVSGIATKKDGSKAKLAWGSYTEIGKAVSIYNDGTPDNITRSLGQMHKIRNFYNNIIDPMSKDGDVTIDTHAVAAALLKPLSGNSKEVSQNFGTGTANSGSLGIKGLYYAYADAYALAAKETGLLPRQVQSITWEAVRGLYKDTFKSQSSNVDSINEIWNKYANGEITKQEARELSKERAGGIDDPTWAGGPVQEGAGISDRESDGGTGIDRIESDTVRDRLAGRKKRMTEPVPGNKLFNKPLTEATDIAKAYMDRAGMEYVQVEKISKLDENNSKRIANAYDQMKDDPTNPEVKEAYDAMINETIDQYEEIIKSGYVVEINNEEPYSSSEDMINDLRENKRMKIFSTESGFGDEPITDEQRESNPLLKETKYKDANGVPLLANDLFRFVHDFFGHAKLGNSFGPIGEENAWRVHSVMYSDLAVKAMTSETRGQNSWVNFSGVNKEVFKKRDKARELRKQGKIEEADALVGEVYEEMKFADQKVGILPEFAWKQGAPARKKRISSPDRTEAINKAQDKYNLSLKRGNTELQAIDAAINDLKKNDWYKNASDTERNSAVRDLEKQLGIKQKSAPSAGRILGKPKDQTITVNERIALRDQIMLEARAAREAAKSEKDARRNLAEFLKERIGKIKGIVKGDKLTTVINRALNMNLSNPEMADRFADYVIKLSKDAEYGEKLSNSNKLRSRIRKKLKQKDIQDNNKSLAKKFLSLDPKYSESIDEYLENAEKVLSSLDKTGIRRGALSIKQQANVDQVLEFIDKSIEYQNKVKMDMIELSFPELFESGAITSDMSPAEAMYIVENIDLEKTDKKISEKKLQEMRDRLSAGIDAMAAYLSDMIKSEQDPMTGENIVLTAEEIQNLKSLLKIDQNNLTLEEMFTFTDLLQNAAINQEISSVSTFVEKIKGRIEANKMYKEKGRLDSEGSVVSSIVNPASGITLITSQVLGGMNRLKEFFLRSGFSAIQDGKAQAIKIAREAVDQYDSMFAKKKANGEGFDSKFNRIERRMYSFLIRSVNGSKLQDAKEFTRRLKLIREQVQLFESEFADENMRRKAAKLREVADKLGIFEDGVTRDDIIARVDKVNADAVSFWIEKFAQYFPEMAEVSMSVYNRELSADINYIPDAYKRVITVLATDVDKMAENASRNGAFGKYDTESTSLTVANRPNALPSEKFGEVRKTTMYIDMDFDSVVSNAFSEAMTDIKTAKPIRRFQGFINSASFQKMVANERNRKLMVDAMERYIRNTKGITASSREQNILGRSVNKIVSTISTLGGSVLLGGADQIIKQPVSMIANTVINSVYVGINNGNFSASIGGLYLSAGKNAGFKFSMVPPLALVASKKYNQWLIDGMVDIKAFRGIESMGTIDQAKFKSQADSVLEKGLDNIKALPEAYVKLFLVTGDKMAAKSAFLMYYKKHLVKSGKSPVIDFSKPMDPKAKSYAMAQVSKQQGESDADMSSMLYSKDTSKSTRSAVKLLMPLSSFILNKKASIISDLSILLRKNADKQDRLSAVQSMSSSVAEVAIYSAVSIMLREMIITQIATAITGYDEEELDKDVNEAVKKENKLRKANEMEPMTDEEETAFRRIKLAEKKARQNEGIFITNLFKDLSPLPPFLEKYQLTAIDEGRKLMQEYTKSDEIEKAIKDQEKIDGKKMSDIKRKEFIANYIENNTTRLMIFDNDNNYGSFGFLGDQMSEDFELVKAERTGEIKTYDGKTKYLTKEQKEIARNLNYLLAASKVAPKDVRKVVMKSFNQLKKMALTANQLDNYNAIKEISGDKYTPQELVFMIKNGEKLSDKKKETYNQIIKEYDKKDIPDDLFEMIMNGKEVSDIRVEIYRRTGVTARR